MIKSLEELDALAVKRKEAGSRLDPQTAEAYWQYANDLDPYGEHPLRVELTLEHTLRRLEELKQTPDQLPTTLSEVIENLQRVVGMQESIGRVWYYSSEGMEEWVAEHDIPDELLGRIDKQIERRQAEEVLSDDPSGDLPF